MMVIDESENVFATFLDTYLRQFMDNLYLLKKIINGGVTDGEGS